MYCQSVWLAKVLVAVWASRRQSWGHITKRVEHLGTGCLKKKVKREVYKLLAYGRHEEKLEAEDSEHNHFEMEMAQYEPEAALLTGL